MAKIFVSHADDGLDQARELCRWLVVAGHEVFLDQDRRDGIVVGELWRQRLHERLRWADAVVCVVTTAYLASRWCAAEVEIARSWGSRLLPVRAEPGVVDPSLESIQHVDMAQDPAAARVDLVAVLRRVDAAGGLGWPDDRSPFPGLRPFDIDQHRVFFGRAEEKKELAELLRSSAVRAGGAALLVVGPSGCGKSSLVRAGLVPVMADEPGWWTLGPIVPGAEPVTALVRELAAAARRIGLDWTVAQVRQQLDSGDLVGLVDELLLGAPGGPQRRLLLVVDQFEELLTQTAPPAQSRFVELLCPALAGPVQLVATLRSEFLDQLLIDPALGVLATHTYALRPLGREALRAVIEQPARLAGIDVDAALVDRLVEDTDSGDALPLLAFTLAQLAEGIRRGGQLSATRYDQLGGVQGALTRQADSALAAAVTAEGRSCQEVIAELLRLVTVDEQSRPTRWRVRRDELPGPVATELDAFVERRLLTTDDVNGSGVIGVAHEAFLSVWPPLHDAIAASVSALRARRMIEHAATAWHDHTCPPSHLWGGGQLAAAIADTGAHMRAGPSSPNTQPPPTRRSTRWLPRRHRVLVTDRVDLSPTARDFLHTSIRRDRYRRRRAITVLSVLLVFALAGAGIAIIQQGVAEEQQQVAEHQARVATARQLVAQADAALKSDPRTALKLGIAAQRIYPGGETHSSLVNSLINTRYSGTLTGHSGWVNAVAFAPDGRTLATGGTDGIVILWDLADPSQPRRVGQPLVGDRGWVNAMAFSPDGRTLATGSANSQVILWDLTDPMSQPRHLGQFQMDETGAVLSVQSVAFAPDGRTLAAGNTYGTTILWDLTNPAQPSPLGPPLTGHTRTVTSVAFAPDGRTLVTGSEDHTAILWDIVNPTQFRRIERPLAGHASAVTSVAYAPDSRTLATGDSDGTVLLWDLVDPAQPGRLGQPLVGPSRVHSVGFAERTLAIAGDGSVILWDLTNPAQPRPLGQPMISSGGVVCCMALSSDGHTLVTDGAANTAIVWDLTGPAQPRRVGEGQASDSGWMKAMAYAPNGRTLATVGFSSVILWDVTDPAKLRRVGLPLAGDSGAVYFVAYGPHGRTLATGGDGGLILWDVTDPAKPRRLGQAGDSRSALSGAFAPDGGTLATGTYDGAMIVWDVTDPAQPRRLGQTSGGHSGAVHSVAYAPDGNTVATGSDDGKAILWDVTDPAQPRRIGQPLAGNSGVMHSVAFASGGRTLATDGGDGTVILWDVTDPVEPRRLGAPLDGDTGPVESVAFAPSGRILAIGGFEATTTLWDVADPARPRLLWQPLTGAGESGSSAAYAPDGNTLTTGAPDGTATTWDLADLNDLLDRATERACSIAGGGLDEHEWARFIPGLPYQDTCPT